MKFRTELELEKSKVNIGYNDKILLLGSCFAENMGNKLCEIKYQTAINPLGIIYHPMPLHKTVVDAIKGKTVSTKDLNINNDGLYTNWNIHSRLSTLDPDETLFKMNDGIASLKKSVSEAKHIILTYGTSYYYNHEQHGPVANCHKFPSINFEKKLSTPEKIIQSFNDMMVNVRMINPSVKIWLTVSPVRHIKDGIVENNRSKAHLLTAVHEICDNHEDCQYLPSYELLIDDLRDYRYYADDMVHPSSKSIDYIWSKISDHILDPTESKLRSDILKLVIAAAHRPFNVESDQHLAFLSKQLSALKKVLESYPHLDFRPELKVFEKPSEVGKN